MRVGIFGGVRQVTGSCFLVETENAKILVDCGYYQGLEACSKQNYEDFGFEVSEIDAVCVTHAHLDHVGRLPLLFRRGGVPPIYSTAPTRDLAFIDLEDAYRIMVEESRRCGHEPLHIEEDVDRVERAWKAIEYLKPVVLAPGVTATFYNAGHILGSSFVVIEADGKRVAFSGDLGSTDVPILPDTDTLPNGIDFLVCEATYGDRVHESTKDRMNRLREAVQTVHDRRGVLMIPAFSIERTQQLLFELNYLVEHERMDVGTVYFDGPLGIKATDIYKKYRHEMDLDLPDDFQDDDLFAFPGLVVTETVQMSKTINDSPNPKIIIAGSGMMNAGRIQHHLLRYLNDERNMLLIIGYQGEGTLGRTIQDGETPVKIFDYHVDVRAEIRKIDSYSAHADLNKLTSWVENSDVKRLALTHGDPEAKKHFRGHLLVRDPEKVIDIAEWGDWYQV